MAESLLSVSPSSANQTRTARMLTPLCARFAHVTALAAMLSAPAAARQVVKPQDPAHGSREAVASKVTVPPDYVIGREDVLSIVFWGEKELSADVVVRPDGKISLPLLKDVPAAGYTPEQLTDVVVKAASKPSIPCPRRLYSPKQAKTGTTAELLALESLRERFVPQSGQGAPADAHGTLADFLSAHIGVLHSSEEIPGGAHMSEASGQKFAAGLLKKREQGHL